MGHGRREQLGILSSTTAPHCQPTVSAWCGGLLPRSLQASKHCVSCCVEVVTGWPRLAWRYLCTSVVVVKVVSCADTLLHVGLC